MASGSGDGKVLITGSWDRTKELLSTTKDAHSDFIKGLFVLPSHNLLISSGSDKIVRFWDLTTPLEKKPLRSLGSISSHTRPVECLHASTRSDTSAALYTADTMGIIKFWLLTKDGGSPPSWYGTLQEELKHHRTRINELWYGSDHLWTASVDGTVQMLNRASMSALQKPPPPLEHPVPVGSVLPLSLTELGEPYLLTGAGDVLRVYDVSTADEPELIREMDAHWHDITAIRLWKRTTVGADAVTRIEPWIVTTSLDGTIRKWRLSELLSPPLAQKEQGIPASVPTPCIQKAGFEMTEDEERELAELMDLN
ncbi:hypothetical protein C0992_000872 [Termitomyces sp. T32_za158]|nr:hypothetical protein C0992_000872 [Termitomyces sp. T32_za158]